jgi:hypothetical protein
MRSWAEDSALNLIEIKQFSRNSAEIAGGRRHQSLIQVIIRGTVGEAARLSLL